MFSRVLEELGYIAGQHEVMAVAISRDIITNMSILPAFERIVNIEYQSSISRGMNNFQQLAGTKEVQALQVMIDGYKECQEVPARAQDRGGAGN